MQKQKSLNNKGFSLVELIIVIAIMAILLGVMAPQLIRYMEKANVSSDKQFADTVRTAVTVAMMDPDVIGATAPGIPANDVEIKLDNTDANFKDEFEKSVAETLGHSDVTKLTDTWVKEKLKSKDAETVWFKITGSNSVEVYVCKAGATFNTANVLFTIK